jgi:hypothetical protein
MKTNASSQIIAQAVDNVSKRLYDGNIVFRKTPEKMTKNVRRFTVKTLDANKKGSLVTKDGVKQTKADWNVHQDIMNEILRLDPRPHIYVDTIYGRQHNKSSLTLTNVEANEKVDVPVEVETQAEEKQTGSRKKKAKMKVNRTERAGNQNGQNASVMKMVQAIKYILQNPQVLND